MPINIHEVLAGITAPWQPEIVDTVNDYDVEHRPVGREEAEILVFEPSETANTGD